MKIATDNDTVHCVAFRAVKPFAAMKMTLLFVLFAATATSGGAFAQNGGETAPPPAMRKFIRVPKDVETSLVVRCGESWCKNGYTVLVRKWNQGCLVRRLESTSGELSITFKADNFPEGWSWYPLSVEVYSATKINVPRMEYAAISSSSVFLQIKDRATQSCSSIVPRTANLTAPVCTGTHGPGPNPWPDPDSAGCRARSN